MLRFGGNTPCIEVRAADDRCLIFDAGTGIRMLGRRLLAAGQPIQAHLFLTHFHWDHIQGIPFFEPLYDPGAVLHIHGPPQAGRDVRSLLAGQMSEAYFPVPLDGLAARIEYADLTDSAWCHGEVEVAAIRVCHPGEAYGYRVRSEGASLAYIPDNELAGKHYPVSDTWYEELLEFLSGVDCLFHDAMFTPQELAVRHGWGHSTFEQAVRLAEEAGVRRLFLFHHAPDRTDRELFEVLERLRSDLRRRGAVLELDIASEGEEVRVRRSEG